MHGWETRMLLKYDLERGVSKAELSRRFGVSRRTIHEWVETGQLDRDLSSGGSRYAPRPPAPHKLDPYTGIIDARLEEYPGLSAQRLFDEVRAAGYPGGYSRVRDEVRAGRPREPTESVVRFETPAGRQGQVDFATFTLPWGRRHALVLLLSHSRLLWLCFYRRQTMAVLTDGLERAFARFGGVPKELLFDQMRAVVLSDQRVGGGELVLNAEFLRFAAHWGFHPRAGRPYRAQTKGKVERPIRYIRDSFFYGRAFANDEDLNEQASRWLEGPANVRRHGTTGERPVDRFERDERAVLRPLARRPYQRLGVHRGAAPVVAGLRGGGGMTAAARADASRAARRRRDRLPAGQPGRRRALLPADQRPARAGVDGADLEQGLRGMGTRARRRDHGGGAHRPAAAPLPHRQHPGQQLPDAGASALAAGCVGTAA